MKYYIIAGEASGDLHASNLIKALYQYDPHAAVRGWGGEHMEQAGATVVKHFQELAFMGFWEVFTNLGTIFSNIRFCKEDITTFQPDVIVFVDYPGFNLRIAKWAKLQGYRTAYYISPQVWAWKSSRTYAIKRDMDRMICILPFETAFYQRYDYAVAYVGHPLLDAIQQLPPAVSFGDKVIALLPGSRKQEISSMLPTMIAVVSYFPDYKFIVAAAPSQPLSLYQNIIGDKKNITVIENQTYALLQTAIAALVTSGTATLETALFDVPQVVCYKGNSISYLIAKQLVKVKYISLVNLIADKPLVKELIQNEFTIENCRMQLQHILQPDIAKAIKTNYAALREQLGGGGASQRAAHIIASLAVGDGL